ncbi:hypothetical protein AAUPMC_16960, partial [Pasteurella multocida subsp. multocida str. Anand1_cattle]
AWQETWSCVASNKSPNQNTFFSIWVCQRTWLLAIGIDKSIQLLMIYSLFK